MPRNHNGPGFSLKDHLFNKQKVAYLSSLLKQADAGFDSRGFEQCVNATLTKLELKARIVHIATCLESYLDKDFKVATTHIKRALPAPLDPNKTDDDFGDFIFAPFGEFVVRNGLAKKHLKTSLETLKEITQRFSMEDAIRYFINAYPEETFATLESWSEDDHYHVRRLASEGTRALLPWSGRLQTDPLKPLPLLTKLHADETRYVTRSVANHLNDISKLQPDLVLDTLRLWQKMGLQKEAELTWMTKHALRTLIKQGHKDTLGLLGFAAVENLQVVKPVLAKNKIKPGEALEFSFTVAAPKDSRLLVDYAIEFVKANGALAAKVFKLKSFTLAAGEKVAIKKRHVFPENPSTLKYYGGRHYLSLQINGEPYHRLPFDLDI